MAPPKSNGRKLPITELARPFFLKQFAMQEAQREQAEKDGKPYYDNDLVVAKPDGSPISASWVSSQFGKLLEDLDMPHIRFHDLRHTAATNMHQLTGDFYTVGEVLGLPLIIAPKPSTSSPPTQSFEKKRNSSALFAREINLVTQPSFDCEQGINSQVQTVCSNADAVFSVLGIVFCKNERFSLSRKTHVPLWNEPRISHVRLL